MRPAAPITRVEASAFVVPTEGPEADGTLTWDHTTLVVAEVTAGGVTGLGYTYAHRCVPALVRETLAPAVLGLDALDVAAAYEAMARAGRNLGRPGLASMALSAVDVALWDLKGRLLDLPLVKLLGQVRASVAAYGSGGFTNYPAARLQEQLASWVAQGLTAVKMKVGADPEADPERVRAARAAIGPEAALVVDANGAHTAQRALAQAARFAEAGVTWFEEPVSSQDVDGLRLVRTRAPAGMEIAAGEYAWDLEAFRRLLEAGAVDVMQPDATRCGGVTGFLRAAHLCEAFGVPVSAHTAPTLHTSLCCAVGQARHVEYFHDHARLEALLFDGARIPVGGVLRPDPSRPGLGFELERADAARFAV